MPPDDPLPPDDQALAERVAAAMQPRDTAPIALGIVLEAIAPGFARMAMRVRDDMLNGHGTCHGGMIFTLADTALAYGCNSRNHRTVAAAADIQFLSPATRGEELIAVARERSTSGRTGIYDVDVTERASGRMVALFRARSHRVGGEIVAS
jgi:acyl-CoA thioesterase